MYLTDASALSQVTIFDFKIAGSYCSQWHYSKFSTNTAYVKHSRLINAV